MNVATVTARPPERRDAALLAQVDRGLRVMFLSSGALTVLLNYFIRRVTSEAGMVALMPAHLMYALVAGSAAWAFIALGRAAPRWSMMLARAVLGMSATWLTFVLAVLIAYMVAAPHFD